MKLRDNLDRFLEWSILGSFARTGASVRRRLDRWTELQRLDGRVIVITGATSGIGLYTARELAQLGATVEILARDREKAAAIVEALKRETGNKEIHFTLADTGDLVALRAAATSLLGRHKQIHALVHNAGALDDLRRESPQGIELTIASQVVGPYLLTELLLPALRAAAPSRVIWVSSGGMYAEPLSVDHLQMGSDYNGITQYARAKRAQVTLSEMWAEKLQQDGVRMHAMHPGWVDTPGVERSLPTFRRFLRPLLRSPAEGADTLLWLLADDGLPLVETGRFWLDRRPRPLHRLARTRRSDTPAERAKLWSWLAQWR